MVDSSRMLVKFDLSISEEEAREILASVSGVDGVLGSKGFIDQFIGVQLSEDAIWTTVKESIKQLPEVQLVEPVYLTANRSPLIVGEHVVVKFREKASDENIAELLATLRVEVADRPKFVGDRFLIRNTRASGLGVIDLANRLHELDLTEWAEPDFRVDVILCGYKLFDYYSAYQTHLKQMIGSFNTAAVWDFANTMRPIKVAVIDAGVGPHEDIDSERILYSLGHDFSYDPPTYDYDGNDGHPDTNSSHGMAVSGILAANHCTDSAPVSAGSGIFSMNPNVQIIPIKIFPNTLYGGCSHAQLANSITWAWQHGADIINCSWIIGDGFPRDTTIYSIDDAIWYASRYGRSYKGTLVVCAAGLGGDGGGIDYPARNPDVIAVGAVDLDGIWCSYSPFDSLSPRVALVASDATPGDPEYWSLDQMGSFGRNKFVGTQVLFRPADFFDTSDVFECPAGADDVDYMCKMYGTSLAAPVVSGVASLLIARDSSLRLEPTNGLKYLLRHSAVREVGGGVITPPDVRYGYGRVDAFRALLSISRGDVDNTGEGPDIGDLTALVGYLYLEWPAPFPSVLLADCNCDGAVDIEDLTVLINYFYNFEGEIVNPCFEF